MFISELVLAEIDDIKSEDLRIKMRKIVINYNILQIDEEIRKLANEYVKFNAIPAKFSEDSLHLAIATLNKIDYLLSWNFKHIVKIKTRQIINMVNINLGQTELKIITPAELL